MLSGIICLVVALYFVYKWIKPEVPPNFPPGPPNYPIVGGALTLQKLDPVGAVAMIKLGEIYGSVTGLYLGKSLTIVVNGYETIRRVLTMEEFNGRPATFNDLLDAKDGARTKGFMFENGEIWKEQRRFSLRHLKDLGFGKSSLEGTIHEEIQECIEILKSSIESSNKSSEGISMENIFAVSIINVLWLVVAGKRFKHEDEEFKAILAKLALSFRTGQRPTTNLISDYPFLRHLPFLNKVWANLFQGTFAVRDVLKESVLAHKEAKKSFHSSNDFIGAYLDQLETLKENGTIGNSHFSEERLVSICSELFGAGAESTSNALAFAMLYMLLYPEVQIKVQKEIDGVVGKERLPSLDDRSELPYTEAVLDEVFRVASIAPLTVPHFTTENVELDGYRIPNKTLVMVNLHSVHMDPEHWGDPENFRPERFIDSQGKFVKSDKLNPFGIGKRICPGESLARMNYFLFFTAMMQTFRLELVPGKSHPSTIPLSGFTLAPQPFKSRLIVRN